LRDGSTSTFSKLRKSGSMKIPRPCARAAKRPSIPSVQSRCGWGATHFLMKTLPKVATEMALCVLTDNLTRVMNIVGVEKLMEAIKG
jgi:hypothetical protein